MAEPTLIADSINPGLPRSERGRPTKIDVSPQGDLLVYPSAKVVVLLRDADLSTVHIFREHRFDTTAVRFSPNGEMVASGDKSGVVCVWQTVEPFEKKSAHNMGAEVADIAWSPDGTKLAIVGDGGRAVYFDLKTGSSGADLTCHCRRIESIAIHPNEKEKLILMASHDSRVSVFDKSNGGCRPKYSQLLTTHNKEVYSVSFNADGSLFASGGADGRLVVYDTATKAKIAERQHDRSITATVFLSLPSLDEGDTVVESQHRKQLLVYASTDGFVRGILCGDPSDGDEGWEEFVDAWEVQEDLQQLALAASPGWLYAVNVNGRLDKRRASDGSLVTSIYGHKGHLKAIDCENGVTVTGDNTGRLCQQGSASLGEESTQAIRGISILCEEKVVGCLRVNNIMEFISLEDGILLSSLALPSEPRGLSKGRNTVAVLCHKHLIIVDRKARKGVEEITLDNDPVAVALLGSDSELTIGDSAGVITVYLVEGPTLSIARTIKMKGAVSALEYSQDGAYLAVADASRYISVYRRDDDWSLVADDWRMHNASIRALGWSPDGKMLVTGGVDRQLIVWKLPEGEKKVEPIMVKSGHMPEALIWKSPIELVTVGEDGCKIHWRLE